ncbi:hypothetical protein T310_6291 [Rasamsonia emersonii CBS 393.64]|uniref:Uncharacterized protein n=1 Tax=Rasamsonia emersonii (strain ATCC 16479 / CBS 393.64 / IMI 116815) TaxID=1408163 RepID=A0A0F4YNQ7_RASE3|nr:hypothetical protein T310_6291 [Rasamsonia emersonii CBS 393.64]KKA19720.1 hypothetical protein T310_6291 [Rasamsonia emersonii CBS 393.64]
MVILSWAWSLETMLATDSDASRKHNVVRFSRRYALRRDTPSTGCTSTASGEPHAGGRPEILGEAKYFVHGWAERSEVQESGSNVNYSIPDAHYDYSGFSLTDAVWARLAARRGGQCTCPAQVAMFLAGTRAANHRRPGTRGYPPQRSPMSFVSNAGAAKLRPAQSSPLFNLKPCRCPVSIRRINDAEHAGSIANALSSARSTDSWTCLQQLV